MAKRAEEKERRRQERLEAERAAQQAAGRKRMFQIGAGALVALIVIGVIVIVATAGGSKGNTANASEVATDAKAASCTYKSFKSEGRTHTTGKVVYKTNPPTSGNHNPVPAQDGIYAPGNSPAPTSFVHSLEHGRIEFQYQKGTSAADQAKLKTLAESKFNGTAGYHTLMFENNTNMPTKFAATAWTHSITCDALTPQTIKAMTAFRNAFTDKGPEFIP